MNNRHTHIDAVKCVAAMLIVLHHFTVYGPIALAMDNIAPAPMTWLFQYGGITVQVFLVISGYLTAGSLAPHGRLLVASPWQAILRRYQRLVLPYAIALVMAILSAGLARQFLGDDFIPEAPELLQMLAHTLLLHGVTDSEALSAGVWYVAIDFQLFVLMLLLLWIGRMQAKLAQLLVVISMVTSLLYFNRYPEWDNWAIYFFGSYALGAVAFWFAHARRLVWGLSLLTLVVLVALVLSFRERIALALVVAVFLALSHRKGNGPALNNPDSPPGLMLTVIRNLGQSSYALFLVHFSVLMLSNAGFAQWQAHLGSGHGAGNNVVVFWLSGLALSLLAGLGFHRWVEVPLSRLRLGSG